MAIAKCDSCGPPVGAKRRYVRSAKPVGYPETAVVCNSSGCLKPGLLWLDQEEAAGYDAGERIFDAITGAAKIRVT